MPYNKDLTGLSFAGGEVLTSGDGVTKMIWKVCDERPNPRNPTCG